MNNLEKEYKALIDEDIPDLWDRIEAGIEPKEKVVKKKKLNTAKIIKFGGFAVAACLCVTVAGPLLLNNMTKMTDKVSNSPASSFMNEKTDSPREEAQAEFTFPSKLNIGDHMESNKGIQSQFKEDTDSENCESVTTLERDIAEYHMNLKVVETEPEVKCQILAMYNECGDLKIDDEISVTGIQELFHNLSVGEEIEVYLSPVLNNDETISYKLIVK